MAEYPNVCVTIPKKAVAPKVKIPLELKVGLLERGSGLEGDYSNNNFIEVSNVFSTVALIADTVNKYPNILNIT